MIVTLTKRGAIGANDKASCGAAGSPVTASQVQLIFVGFALDVNITVDDIPVEFFRSKVTVST